MTPKSSDAAASTELPTCSTCGAASPGARDKSGHLHYGRWLSYLDFEQILLSLGASGSDVRRLWPDEATSAASCCGWHLLTLPASWRGHVTYCRCGTLLVLREGTWRRG